MSQQGQTNQGLTQGPRYFEWTVPNAAPAPRLAALLFRADTPTGLAPGINGWHDLDTWTRNQLAKGVQTGAIVVTETGRAWVEGEPLPQPQVGPDVQEERP